jgi:hypothetical protein
MIGPPFCHLDQRLLFFTGPNFFFRASQRLALISGTANGCDVISRQVEKEGHRSEVQMSVT